jgi:uncharacterized repeat protein (TIGR03847 family)
MSMRFGEVQVLGTDAVGQPGQRRFRLFLRSGEGTAILWMEKEQLSGVAEALDRSLAIVSDGKILRVEASTKEKSLPEGIPDDFPVTPTYEVQVGQMRLNFSEADELFSLYAAPLSMIMGDDQEPQVVVDEENSILFLFNKEQAKRLASAIPQVLGAGRPVCPLCHQPLDGGPHACIKQNGHRPIVRIEERGEDQ